LLESGSFGIHKNTAVPIIVILDHSELDMEVSDVGMETTESNDYSGMSRKDTGANGVLAVT